MSIVALVVTEDSKKKVLPGGTPVFIASNAEEQQKLAHNLSRVLGAMAHDLENEIIFIVKH